MQGNSFLDAWGRTSCSIYSCVRSQGIEDCRSCLQDVCTLRGAAENVCPLRSGAEDKGHWMWRIAQHLRDKGAPCKAHSPVPLRSLMRLRWYLTALDTMEGTDIISSRELADRVGVGAAMVRKDFSYCGDLGTPGLGYHVADLQWRLRAILEEHTCMLAWVGAQWLNDVLTSFVPTLELNYQIVAAFDTRPEWIGKRIGEWEVLPLSDLTPLVSAGSIDGVVLALPEEAAYVANTLIEVGVKGILNLTPETLIAPATVSMRHIDLVGEIMALAMEVSERDEAAATGAASGSNGNGRRRVGRPATVQNGRAKAPSRGCRGQRLAEQEPEPEPEREQERQPASPTDA